MKRKPNSISEWIAVSVVAFMSLLHIAFNIFGGWHPSFIVTIIGLGFLCLFFLNIRTYIYLFFVWAVVQLIDVRFVMANGEPFFLSQGISQFFSTGFYLNLNTAKNINLQVGISAVGVLYMIVGLRVKMDSIYGNVYRLRSLKKDSFLSEFLPADAKIIRRVAVGEEKSWFVVELLGKEIPTYGLIRGKDEYMISKGENQIIHYRAVDDPQWALKATVIDKNLYKREAWAVVE